MTIADIEKIIAGEETRTLEVKESTGEIVKGMASACAFLNSDGGWLIFGVTPKMKIVGQNVSDSTRQEVSNHLRRLEPSLDAAAEYIPVPGRDGFYVSGFELNEHKNEHNLVLDNEEDKPIFEHKMSTKTQNEHKNEHKTAKNAQNEHKNEHKKNPREYAHVFDPDERDRINQIIESLNYNTQKNINEILWMIQGDENISINRLVQELKLPKITVRRCLDLLQELRLIERVGANCGGHWKIVHQVEGSSRTNLINFSLDKLDKLNSNTENQE